MVSESFLNESKHILDPEKLAKVFGRAWIHPRIPDEHDEYEEERYDTSAFIFQFSSGYSLNFHHMFPFEVTISDIVDRPAGERCVIHFSNITGVKYLYKYKTLVLDSRRIDTYSQLWINDHGEFRVSVNLPIFYYHDQTWINTMGDGMQEETIRR